MGILGKIINPEKLIEQVGKGIDKLVDGQGEKAERFTELLRLYEPFKVAQRVLAFMFSGVYLFIHLLTGIAYLVVAVSNVFFDVGLNPSELDNVFKWNNENLLYIVLTIVLFYFSGGVINGALKRIVKKVNNK